MKTLEERKKDFSVGKMIEISEIISMLKEMKETEDKDLNKRSFSVVYNELKEIGKV